MVAETNPIASALMAQSFGLTGDRQKQLLASQQQAAMAQALLSQGAAPLDTSNRQIGGVGYAISPWEGAAKLAQGLLGGYEQKKANENYVNALFPSSDSSSGGQTASAPSMNFYDAQGNLTPIGYMQILNGNRAVAEMRPTNEVRNAQYAYGNQAQDVVKQIIGNQASPGDVKMQEALGTSAAGAMPYGTMPNNAAALANYRTQNGMQAPPVDAQRANMGLPVGESSNAPMGTQPPITPVQQGGELPNIPQIPASQLQPAFAAPNPNGMSADQYKAALEAAKSGSVAASSKTGENLADATKTFNVAAGSLPRAMQRFDELRQAAKSASYGGGVSEEGGDGGFHVVSPDYAREYARTTMGQFTEPEKALANQKIDQAAKQGILSELGPQLQGLKGNRYLEMIASGASGLNPADPPNAKLQAINGLQDQYISNMKSLAEQRRSYGDPNAPSDLDMANLIAQHADPSQMISVVDPKGNLGRVSATHLPDLIQSGGKIR